MSTRPKIIQKTCPICDTYLTGAAYYKTRSKFFSDGHLPICKDCLAQIVSEDHWSSIDKFCQWADYPFMPDVWTKLKSELKEKALDAYVMGYCASSEYPSLNWKTVEEEWKELLEKGTYKNRLPQLSNDEIEELRYNWGENYNLEELKYMQKFYDGLCKSHNIITETQRDAARTLAKLSIRISQKISSGGDVDKDITSYDKLMKSNGFTTENVKNMSDFESVGELVAYLEKTGWKNPYYDDVPKDVVDTTISNIQAYTRRLIMGETNLKESVEQKLAALGMADAGEFELGEEELARYDNDGFMEIEVSIDDEDERRGFEVDET